jgi:hypothetical protein
MAAPDAGPPADSRPTRWIGAAPVPEGEGKRRRRLRDDTLDLPAEERAALEAPEIRYAPPRVEYAPPPRYGPPVGYREPRRRRRKWPWVFAFLALCCVGGCLGAFAYVKPFYDQYPATATTTATVTGLTVVPDTALSSAARRLSKTIDTGQLDEATFSVVYAESGNSRHRVAVFGSTRFVADPPKDLTDTFGKLGGDLALSGVRDVDAGPLGGVQRCGTGRLDGRGVAVCGWVDHGSVGVGVFTNLSVTDSVPLLQTIRAAIIRRG